MSKFVAWLAVGALACAADTAVPAAGQFVIVARSAQLTLEASPGQDGVLLRLLPRAQGAATGIANVSVSLDGTSEPVKAQADGSWWVPLPAARAAHGGKLDVNVVHDGIREMLSGTLPPAPGAAGAGGGPLRVAHKQLAWWVLNIVVVLIGVIALSRRMS
ncbi:MAG: hypothetical protein JOZ89_11600 [Gammaproteobacteria bacterium]|nr:hypothetical protein [Gammaproteobacteria bacterium]